MSTLLQSDPDLSSTDSLEQPVVLKVPLSTSVVLEKLPKAAAQPEPIEKISIRFQPIGSAPAINPSSYKIATTQTIGSILLFLMRRLKLKTINIYVLSSFQPTPDERLGDLYGMFKSNGELLLSYCESVAFG